MTFNCEISLKHHEFPHQSFVIVKSFGGKHAGVKTLSSVMLSVGADVSIVFPSGLAVQTFMRRFHPESSMHRDKVTEATYPLQTKPSLQINAPANPAISTDWNVLYVTPQTAITTYECRGNSSEVQTEISQESRLVFLLFALVPKSIWTPICLVVYLHN